jgi:hypothetical protein
VTDITDAPDHFRQFENGKGVTMRRFPPPWSIEELDACFVVTDSTKQKLAYVHFEDNPERRSAAMLLRRDEAPQIVGQLCEAAGFGRHDVLGF